MIDPELREDGPAITDVLLRQFAAIWLLFFGGLAISNGVFRQRTGIAIVFGLLAVAVGLPGLLRPRTVQPVFRSALAVATPIGWVMSHLLLAIIFYLVITPIAFVFKMIGRDALTRRFDKNARTYWIERRQSTDPRRYLHQS
jgi:hypothetical protein